MATSWEGGTRPGVGWEYDDAGIAYDSPYDQYGSAVCYESDGKSQAWADDAKPVGIRYLLTEALGRLLLENGGSILLLPEHRWTDDTRASTSWTKELKP